jgi:hypothetical protein
MQPKASIEVDGAVALPRWRYTDAWTQLVIALFEKRDDHVQTIGRTTLEDRDEDFPFVGALSSRANEPRRCGAHADHRHCRGAKKEAAGEHAYLR